MPEQKKSLASSTDGFSILGTIIAIALVGIGIKVMSQFSSNVIRLNRQFSKSAAYEEVEESIRSMINKGLRTYWAKECRTDGGGFALAFGAYNPINKLRNEYTALYGETNLKADSIATMVTRAEVGSLLVLGVPATFDLQTNASVEYNDAINRCNSYSKNYKSIDQDYNLCFNAGLKYNILKELPRYSFMVNSNALIEVRIDFKTTRGLMDTTIYPLEENTGSTSCHYASFLKQGGARVRLGLYWMDVTNNRTYSEFSQFWIKNDF